ncbi:hypothetical protein C9J03_12745 [Photobacterium gaetbulicola]|nr:hypothetical protein C9J03_12745 [Photobacterium gaetbulicola]
MELLIDIVEYCDLRLDFFAVLLLKRSFICYLMIIDVVLKRMVENGCIESRVKTRKAGSLPFFEEIRTR